MYERLWRKNLKKVTVEQYDNRIFNYIRRGMSMKDAIKKANYRYSIIDPNGDEHESDMPKM